MANTVTAKLKYLRIPPRKVRLLTDVVKGLSVNEAEARLMLSPRRAGLPILKLIKSAVANAKFQKLDAAKLFIKEIRVDQGPKFKRWTPRARGSASPIEKKTSHVSVVLEVSDKVKAPRFAIKEKSKKEKEKERLAKEHGHDHRDHEETDKKTATAVKPTTAGTGFRKVFRRKSI